MMSTTNGLSEQADSFNFKDNEWLSIYPNNYKNYKNTKTSCTK